MEETKGKIAFQGFHGAYSDMACRAACPGMETLPCVSFEECFTAVREGTADLAMIPVDNTLAGRVADVHHLLPRGGLFIVAEHFQPIRHALLGVRGADIAGLKYVHSHVHALPQCRKTIARLGLERRVAADTAGAAAAVAQAGDPAHAAIASPLAASIYGLDILIEDIQDADHNTTRFLILSREKKIPVFHDGDKILTSLTYRVRNIPAALYKTLGGFATNGIGLVKLESYVGEGFGVAQFYIEIEGHPDSPSVGLALEELGFYADEIGILGIYPAHAFRSG